MSHKKVYLERSPAKINLFLKVLEKRTDNFHNLETLFQALELSDHISFEISYEKGQSENLEFSLDLRSNKTEIENLADDNLISKAIEIYFTELPQKIINKIKSIDFKIFVDKQIPLQAGLAGGSANAAATLRVLNKFFYDEFNFSFKDSKTLELALALGSDVPFCLVSLKQKRVYAEARGEKFKNRKFEFDFDTYKNLVLVKPDFGIATADAFRELSKLNSTSKEKDGFYNSFEKVVYEMAPELLTIHEQLTLHDADHVMLSGSGSTMLGFFENADIAHNACEALSKFFRAKYFIKQTRFLS